MGVNIIVWTCQSKLYTFGAAVAQEVERVIYLSEGQWFDSRLLWSACQSVLGQNTEPKTAYDGCAIGVFVNRWMLAFLRSQRLESPFTVYILKVWPVSSFKASGNVAWNSKNVHIILKLSVSFSIYKSLGENKKNCSKRA